MNLHETPFRAASIRAYDARPTNRRTHYHVSNELPSSQQRQRCLALRLEGPKLRDIAREVGIAPSTVNGYIHQVLRGSRAALAAMGEQIREQERARLQAIIDRWQPVATGAQRTREAARAAEIVHRAGNSLRVLFGLPVAAPQALQRPGGPARFPGNWGCGVVPLHRGQGWHTLVLPGAQRCVPGTREHSPAP